MPNCQLGISWIFLNIQAANTTKLFPEKQTKHDTTASSNIACQNTLKEVEHWCYLSRLYINIDKTKSMVIQSRKINIDQLPSVEISGKSLQNVSKYEYLGVKLDDKLNMNSHIDHIIKTVQGKLCILRKISRYITENY